MQFEADWNYFLPKGDDWSSKQALVKLRPHLSTIDAFLISDPDMVIHHEQQDPDARIPFGAAYLGRLH